MGRLDAIGVIGPALEAMVGRPGTGAGAARALGLPYTTVRDWRRRFVARAEMLAVGFARACVALGAPAAPAGRGSRRRWPLGALSVGMAGGPAALRPGRGPPVALRQRASRRSPAHHQHTSALVKRLKVVLDAYWACRGPATLPIRRHSWPTNTTTRPKQLALFRYRVISEAASPRLSPAERGRLARELAARTWVTPEGTERSVKPHQH